MESHEIPKCQKSIATAISVAESAKSSSGPERLRYWETPQALRCPLVGLCLTMREQRDLLAGVRISHKDKTPHEIHQTIIAAAREKSRLSHRIDRLLARKYESRARHLRALSLREFLGNWKVCRQTGKYATALWAAATWPGLPDDTLEALFGDVHMAMHDALLDVPRQTEDIARLDEQLRELRGALREKSKAEKRMGEDCARLAARIASAEGGLARSEQENARLTQKIEELRAVGPSRDVREDNLQLRSKVTSLIYQLEVERERRERAEGDLARMRGERDGLQAACARGASCPGVAGEACDRTCDATCPNFDVCGKCVLFVGGIERMRPLLRNLVETGGGLFEYHDGDLRNGAEGLEGRMMWADMVLCPVNPNSHGACKAVKRFGKKYGKPVHFLSNSSLSAVREVLRQAGNAPGEGM
ncbi:MAG: DUF2325 domain-containing protein [Desulfatibacillaceae bacterium]